MLSARACGIAPVADLALIIATKTDSSYNRRNAALPARDIAVVRAKMVMPSWFWARLLRRSNLISTRRK